MSNVIGDIVPSDKCAGLGCCSLCVPILHRLGDKQVAPTMVDTLRQIELVWPWCGHRGVYPLGRIQCPQCSLVITVQVETSPGRRASP